MAWTRAVSASCKVVQRLLSLDQLEVGLANCCLQIFLARELGQWLADADRIASGDVHASTTPAT